MHSVSDKAWKNCTSEKWFPTPQSETHFYRAQQNKNSDLCKNVLCHMEYRMILKWIRKAANIFCTVITTSLVSLLKFTHLSTWHSECYWSMPTKPCPVTHSRVSLGHFWSFVGLTAVNYWKYYHVCYFYVFNYSVFECTYFNFIVCLGKHIWSFLHVVIWHCSAHYQLVYMLSLLLDLEDGGSTFLLHVLKFLTD